MYENHKPVVILKTKSLHRPIESVKSLIKIHVITKYHKIT